VRFYRLFVVVMVVDRSVLARLLVEDQVLAISSSLSLIVIPT
jgi:hypothetical protein